MKKRLYYKIHKISEITLPELAQMKAIYLKYYDLPQEENFNNDFYAKDHVIVLRDRSTHEIKGFSTQKILSHKIAEKNHTAIFSGDTVIEKDYWGDKSLSVGFYAYLIKLSFRRPWRPVYWHLISKGYKTYLLLANNFITYYPHPDKETPEFYQSLMDNFAWQLYPKAYKKELGLLQFDEPHERLKEKTAPIDDLLIQKNPKIAYFVRRNPAWQRGDELVCIGQFNLLLPFLLFLKLLKIRCQKSMLQRSQKARI
jgi:hypothetical protein